MKNNQNNHSVLISATAPPNQNNHSVPSSPLPPVISYENIIENKKQIIKDNNCRVVYTGLLTKLTVKSISVILKISLEDSWNTLELVI